MNKITTAQKTLEYYVVLSGESTPPGPTPTQVTIDGNFEIEQSGSTYTMSFGIRNFDWSSLQSGWTGTVVYGQNTLTFDSSNLNNNTITISVSESQIDLTATTATMEITSGTDEYEGTSNVEVGFVDYMFIENTYNGTNTITLTTTNTGTPTSGAYATSVQYSKDKSTWTTLTLTAGSSNSITLNQGEKVYFRNDNGKWSSYVNDNNLIYNTFTSTQSIVAGGELYTLLDYTNSSVGLSNGCFFNLFRNCTTLATAPDLSFTTMATRCYQNIFYGCTSLTTAPSFPATTMADFCYQGVFYGCTSLTTAPVLPATTLSSGCYQSMFRGCTSLTTAPSLPATTLVNGCYASMFRECSGLTATPSLQATTLASSAYVNMFRDCTSLNSVTTYANDISAYNCTVNWLNNVAATGTFYNNGSATYTTSSPDGIPAGWTEVKPQPAIDYFYIENEYNGSNTITITTTKYDYSEEDPEADPLDMTKCGTNLEWSKDKSTWNTLTLTESSPNTITMNQGEKVYFRNDTGKFNYMDDNGSFWHSSFTNNNSASTGGDIHTLIDYTGTNISGRESYCLFRLFQENNNLIDASNLTLPSSLVRGELYMLFFGCSSLTTPPSLPATTLAEYCYKELFAYCQNLTTPPSLPATTLAGYCYQGMFSSSGITTVPVLPATTLAEACYMEMFMSCESLTTIPSNYLPATSLEYSCYSRMFAYCSNLTTPPSLPATTLSDYCYYGMFSGCSGFTTIPSNYLPATSLGHFCYSNMFQNCTSLTSAPALPATDLTDCTFCYESMFQGCSSLTTPPSLPATTLAENCYSYMFESSGITTAPILPATTLEMACYSYMFMNCSSLTTPPVLPATNLASNCYMYMFPGSGITTAPVLTAWNLAEYCYQGMLADTSITTAPELWANTLVEGCYMEMFANCENLNEVTCYATDITATDCTTGWLNNVAETGTLYAQRGVHYTADDPSGVPEGWSVVRMEPS